ncbi:IPT/TIG domain-containing protein [Kitasatospora sp. NPDC101235]|uniref:IPT/TIG domain-containing protein n=1 Tax=Kitasatospora sp. NPDC101235 TaxID=3364101 RepID=UPI00382AB0C5
MALVPDIGATRSGRWRRLRPGTAAAVTAMVLGTLGAVVPATTGHAAPPAKLLYIANAGATSVTVYDPVAKSAVATVQVGSRPQNIAMSPDGSEVYVPNAGGNTVSVIDTTTNTVAATIQVDLTPFAVAFAPDGGRAYVANYGTPPRVDVIDTGTRAVVAQIPVGRQSSALAVTPDGGRVYVAHFGADTVSVIDTATNTVTETIPADRGPYGVAVGKIAQPTVTGVSPAHGPVAGGTTVTLTGKYLAGTTAVTIGGVPATDVTVVNRSTVTATVPAHAAGAVDVTATVAGRDLAAGKYTYDAPAPVVTAVAPDHGPLAGGTTVTLTGTNLTGTTAVNFGTVPATAFTVDSDTQITATVPTGTAPGAVDVTVTTPAGTGAAGKYTYEEGSYVFSKTADPAPGSTVKTGDKVTYTVTVAQKGTGEVKGATLTDDLSKVLDDAAYNGDVKATTGTADVKDGKLTWTGDLPQDGTATITYSVTVNANGDKQLHNTVTTTDDKRGTCDTTKTCTTDHTATPTSTPTPTPTSTPTDAGRTPGTPGPSASTTAPAAPEGSSTPPATGTSPAPVAPVAGQASGALASTGSTALTTAMISGALLILGGLALAIGRRRRRLG